MRTKKSQVEALFPLIVSLIGVGIVLVVGFLIFAEAKTQVVELIPSNSVENEAITFSTNTSYIALSNSANAVELTCSQLINGSGGEIIGAGNYTCLAGSGILITNESGVGIDADLFVNYTHKQASRAYNATSDVQNATQDIPGWLSIIVITVIGALLIGLVQYFRRK